MLKNNLTILSAVCAISSFIIGVVSNKIQDEQMRQEIAKAVSEELKKNK